ncbi:MAG: transglutaminase domain-containing protein [Bacteroidota bacterium]
MLLRVSCFLELDLEFPTPLILMLRPRSGPQQWIGREEYNISPTVPVDEYTDPLGNLCQRLVTPAGHFSIYTSADVRIADFVDTNPGGPFIEIQNLPDSVLSFLLPSRYCESDRLNSLAVSITANNIPGYDQVAAIKTWLRDNIQYIPGSSDFPISAMEVYERKYGVCRDLAHLGIALCRSLSIPARMVVGYLNELYPMDMHAWFEAYVGGRWYTFDATQNDLKGGYVSIGYGSDAVDVALFNQFGPAVKPTNQIVTVESIEK